MYAKPQALWRDWWLSRSNSDPWIPIRNRHRHHHREIVPIPGTFSLSTHYLLTTLQGVTGTCNKDKIKPVAKITGYVKLPANNYSALMNAVTREGPIAISAAAEPWQLYSGGVYNGNCGSDIDHAIVLVGYGTAKSSDRQLLGGGGGGGGGGDYWLVRCRLIAGS